MPTFNSAPVPINSLTSAVPHPHGLHLISLLLHDYFQCTYRNEAPASPCFVVFQLARKKIERCNECTNESTSAIVLYLAVSELFLWQIFMLQISQILRSSSTTRKIRPVEAGGVQRCIDGEYERAAFGG